MITERIKSLLDDCNSDKSRMPPTVLYNEGWMLRLVLDWLYQNRSQQLATSIPFQENAEWYSEALLPSAFLARYRGDKLAESFTHADGAVGNFTIGSSGTGDLRVDPHGQCLSITEAKMFSKLSAGVTNASYFNQAARNVACIAEVLRRSDISFEQLEHVGFYVIAPEVQIDAGIFVSQMSIDHVRATVEKRVLEYGSEQVDWWSNWFLPTLDQIDLRIVSWETLMDEISQTDPEFGSKLSEYYSLCLEFNGQFSRGAN